MLGPLQAERQLAAIEAASVPHMKQEAITKVVRRYERRVERPGTHRAATMHEALMQAGIPVEVVPRKPSPKGKHG